MMYTSFMEVDSKELQEYIKSALTAIKGGLDGTGFKIRKPVEFNLAVTNTIEGGGGLKIYIAKAEGKLKSEQVSHIKFEAQIKRETVHIYRPPVRRTNPGRYANLFGYL